MSIQPSGSVGKGQKMCHFEAVFRDLASGCAKLTLVAAVEAEINEGKTLPMFDEHGEFIEHQ